MFCGLASLLLDRSYLIKYFVAVKMNNHDHLDIRGKMQVTEHLQYESIYTKLKIKQDY